MKDENGRASPPPDPARRMRQIVIGSLGNLVEWYDFYAYTAFAFYFGPAFFPGSDPVVQQLNAAVIFAATFLARPFGGWLFGYLADRYGRRLSLTVSVGAMCFGSLLIAAAPTYERIGIAAPIILALARIIEGLSLGGEYGASATYLAEIADPKKRGFHTSFQYMTLIGGQLVAILVLLALQQLLSDAQLKAGGWRIPFVIGAALAVFTLVMRQGLEETGDFKSAEAAVARTSILRALLGYPRALMLVVGLTAGGTAAFYTFTTYMQTYVHLSVGLSQHTTTLVVFFSLLFAALLQPLYGALSDRIGRTPLLVFFGLAGSLATVPLLTHMKDEKNPVIVCLLICAAWIFVAGYTSINALVKAELFPTSIRASGVAIPYALTVSIFGGTAPALALKFKTMGHESWFFSYLAGMIFLSLVVYLLMRNTGRTTALDRIA